MRTKSIIIGLGLMLALSACMKEELPVQPRTRGDAMTVSACMGPGYQDQLWLDISSGMAVSTNPKTAWDLAFESAPEGWRIYLNGSKLMTAWDRGAVAITQPHDTAGMGAGRRIDAPSGHRDSTAIRDWRGTDAVYIIDLGVNALGQSQGLRKFRFRSVTGTAYEFEVALLDGTQLETVTVVKDPSRSFTCYKAGVGTVPIEPPRGAWDMVVTQYTHQFYDPFMPYIVTGVLTAPTTRAALIPDAEFEAVTLADTLMHPLGSKRDAIGYDWKRYSFETSTYAVDTRMVYILQDAEGYFYKMHFIDFYGEQGQVGCPRFEVVPL
ncbi:MAG: HmuY family protein [Flavobacteriales bacterium]|nr:MAG: HmuY family protein [Flavobacteriales bacterium]